MECPFCDFQPTDENSEHQILQHVDLLHSENDAESAFASRDNDLALALALQQEEEALVNHNKSPSHSIVPSKRSKSRSKETLPEEDDFPFAECPHQDCGELVHLAEYNYHLDLHELNAASSPSLEDTKSSSPSSSSFKTITNNMIGSDSGYDTDPRPSLKRSRESLSESLKSGGQATIARTVLAHVEEASGEEITKTRAKPSKHAVRLGKSELGPYAWEERMPESLIRQLQKGGQVRHLHRISRDGRLVRDTVVENEVSGTVPALARLLPLVESLEAVYLCHSSVQHVFKCKKESHFCGYRNIQMLASFLQGTGSQGHERLGKGLPGILDVQNLIEEAWDQGIDTLARKQTGGIRFTRKWIGTPEAYSVLKLLKVPCLSQVFSDTARKRAYECLLDNVETYFISEISDKHAKVHKTELPPIYLQQPGHSLTIIGLERHKDGTRNLLVLDPSFGPSTGMKRMLERPGGVDISKSAAKAILEPYRRRAARLQPYATFETLALNLNVTTKI